MVMHETFLNHGLSAKVWCGCVLFLIRRTAKGSDIATLTMHSFKQSICKLQGVVLGLANEKTGTAASQESEWCMI